MREEITSRLFSDIEVEAWTLCHLSFCLGGKTQQKEGRTEEVFLRKRRGENENDAKTLPGGKRFIGLLIFLGKGPVVGFVMDCGPFDWGGEGMRCI